MYATFMSTLPWSRSFDVVVGSFGFVIFRAGIVVESHDTCKCGRSKPPTAAEQVRSNASKRKPLAENVDSHAIASRRNAHGSTSPRGPKGYDKPWRVREEPGSKKTRGRGEGREETSSSSLKQAAWKRWREIEWDLKGPLSPGAVEKLTKKQHLKRAIIRGRVEGSHACKS